MTLNGRYALYCRKGAFLGAHHKKMNEDRPTLSAAKMYANSFHIHIPTDPYYQRQVCSAMTVVSGNIRFMRIFEKVPWRRGVKWQWGNRKRLFSGLSHATFSAPYRKWGRRYYIVLFTPLSPFHWSQNTWHWMAILREIYTFYIFTVVCLHTWLAEMCGCAEVDRDPQYIWDPRKTADLSYTVHRQNLNE